ncbi:hypothetical protein, partial [Erwinia amylovora]
CDNMPVCRNPQQNPTLYPVMHKLIHTACIVAILTSNAQTFSLQCPRKESAPSGALSETFLVYRRK